MEIKRNGLSDQSQHTPDTVWEFNYFILVFGFSVAVKLLRAAQNSDFLSHLLNTLKCLLSDWRVCCLTLVSLARKPAYFIVCHDLEVITL